MRRRAVQLSKRREQNRFVDDDDDVVVVVVVDDVVVIVVVDVVVVVAYVMYKQIATRYGLFHKSIMYTIVQLDTRLPPCIQDLIHQIYNDM